MKNLALLLAASASLTLWPDTVAAAPKAKRVTPLELFRQAETAADNYEFAAAAELLERYSEALPRRGKAPVSDEELQTLTDRVERGRLMMDRVEKIVVIDSISVPKKDFFAHYRLDPSAGTLRDASVLPQGLAAVEGQPVYTPESGLTMMWSMPDSTGRGVIAELSLLADGTYEPVVKHPELNVESYEATDPVEALFPFMMADGLTLYYAMDNPEMSMGGLDIFFTCRDGAVFMQPQNLGMPYNSPANDYMLAIDETTGTGWWATDRNYEGGDTVTIYRFIPNELRVNYNASETPDLASLARLDSWRATQPAGADYSELLARPAGGAGTAEVDDLMISIPGRGVVATVGQLRSSQARKLAKELLLARSSVVSTEARLEELRRSYASGKRGVAAEIKSLERKLPSLRLSVKRLRNEIIKAER